jgi:hypothetical protein
LWAKPLKRKSFFEPGANMLQRGRQSRASVVTFPVVDLDQTRLVAPSWLSRDERKLFCELVGSTRARHFTPADEPLLVAYVQAVLLGRRAIKKAGKDRGSLATWERSTKIAGTLATKLRLCPQSRIDAVTVTRGRPSSPVAASRPWEES